MNNNNNNNNKLNVYKVDTDNNMDIASDLNINSIPSLLIMKNGEILSEIIGYVSIEKLQKEIDTHN